MSNIVLQEKSCVITSANEWEVSEEIAAYEKYKGKLGENFVSLTFASKGDKHPLKLSLTPEQAKGLEFGTTGTIFITFRKNV